MDKILDLKKTVIKKLDSNKALDIVSIDLSNKSSIADYMIIASGTSSRHIQALSEQVLEEFKIKILKHRFKITDKELFSNNLDQMGINFNHSLDPLTWIFDLFRATGSQAIELERFGIESLEYFDPKTIRDIINKELLDLSEAHHERYFKKAN